MKSIVVRVMAALSLACGCGAPQPHAGLVLDLTIGGTTVPCGTCGVNGTTVGWAFDVTAPISVDGIGVWDSDISIPFSTEAGLFTSSRSLLESAVITTFTSTPVASALPEGQWLFERFAPITLPVGEYLIGNVFGDRLPLAEVGPGFVTIPQITFLNPAIGTTNGGFSAPTGSFKSLVFGPTLETGVPDPATWAMMIVGFLAMVRFAARRRSSGTALAA